MLSVIIDHKTLGCRIHNSIQLERTAGANEDCWHYGGHLVLRETLGPRGQCMDPRTRCLRGLHAGHLTTFPAGRKGGGDYIVGHPVLQQSYYRFE